MIEKYRKGLYKCFLCEAILYEHEGALLVKSRKVRFYKAIIALISLAVLELISVFIFKNIQTELLVSSYSFIIIGCVLIIYSALSDGVIGGWRCIIKRKNPGTFYFSIIMMIGGLMVMLEQFFETFIQ